MTIRVSPTCTPPYTVVSLSLLVRAIHRLITLEVEVRKTCRHRHGCVEFDSDPFGSTVHAGRGDPRDTHSRTPLEVGADPRAAALMIDQIGLLNPLVVTIGRAFSSQRTMLSMVHDPAP